MSGAHVDGSRLQVTGSLVPWTAALLGAFAVISLLVIMLFAADSISNLPSHPPPLTGHINCDLWINYLGGATVIRAWD
jgi:hypothetical protein